MKENHRFFNYVCTFLCRDENAYHKLSAYWQNGDKIGVCDKIDGDENEV